MVGVYLSSLVEDDKNTTVTVTISGDECPWPHFGPNCIMGIEMTTNVSVSYNFTSGDQDQYFYYDAPTPPEYVVMQYLSFTAKLKTGELVAGDEVLIYARYLGTPSSTVHDGVDSPTQNSTVTIESPRRGWWVFYVHAIKIGTYEFEVMEKHCPMLMAGNACQYHVVHAYNNMSLTITSKESQYITFRTTADQGLLVSVTTNNSSNIPYIYASRFQIPVISDKVMIADIINCNRDYCSIVRSIAHNSTTAEDWYILLEGAIDENVTYGLWFNSSCVPGCADENHGSCQESGKCMCEIDFEGIDCSVSKGLGPQYIVLIIIASLVVASAIIGFVAWAYMRRKRANYEIVS